MQHTADSGAYEVIPALTEIDVLAAAGTHACVIFGDSTVANEAAAPAGLRACAQTASKT